MQLRFYQLYRDFNEDQLKSFYSSNPKYGNYIDQTSHFKSKNFENYHEYENLPAGSYEFCSFRGYLFVISGKKLQKLEIKIEFFF